MGELRTFDDSYNLAEPEPYQPEEIVELDIVGPDVIEEIEPELAPEADMAGNEEGIDLADPPLGGQAQDPVQGQDGQQDGGNVANEQPPPCPRSVAP